jgi:hypothetical protein
LCVAIVSASVGAGEGVELDCVNARLAWVTRLVRSANNNTRLIQCAISIASHPNLELLQISNGAAFFGARVLRLRELWAIPKFNNGSI